MLENYLVLLLGTNQGNKAFNLECAIKKLVARVGPCILKSCVYQTEAWGKTDQAVFFNQVIVLDFAGTAQVALNEILEIERELGRIRIEKWGERLIDIDILFFGNRIISESRLQVPHPYLHLRNFTLQPLKEIGEQWVHPILNKTIHELMEDCPDNLKVEIVEN